MFHVAMFYVQIFMYVRNTALILGYFNSQNHVGCVEVFFGDQIGIFKMIQIVLNLCP